jgi:hypothetical protein
MIFGGTDEVNQLSYFSLMRCLIQASAINTEIVPETIATHIKEKFKEIYVIRLLAEVLLQELIQCGFEHEGIINSDVIDALYAIPAGLSTARNRGIHHIIRDQETCLELSSYTESGRKV